MKIGLFTDTHYCELEKIEQDRRPCRAYEAVKTAYDDFKKNGVSVAVCLGDIIHFNNGIGESVRHLEKISKLIKSYEIPTYLCMGNHDNEVLSSEDFKKMSGFKIAPCCDDFDDVRLVFIDASYTPDGKPFERVYVDWTKSFVPVKELEWLDKMLDTDKKCCVFIHQNIDTTVEEHHIVFNAEQVNSVIAKHSNVSGVYQGHYHFGAESVINGIPYTTLRAMCIGDEINYKIAEV